MNKKEIEEKYTLDDIRRGMPNKEGMLLKLGLIIANEQDKTNTLLFEIKELLEKKR